MKVSVLIFFLSVFKTFLKVSPVFPVSPFSPVSPVSLVSRSASSSFWSLFYSGHGGGVLFRAIEKIEKADLKRGRCSALD